MTLEPRNSGRIHDLVSAALDRVPRGEWLDAARDLEEAAALYAQERQTAEQAKCLEFAAKLRRNSGDRAGSSALLGEIPSSPGLAAEQAESLFAEGKFADSVNAWTRLLDAGLPGEAASAVLRRRAEGWLAQGTLAGAAADYAEAASLIDSRRSPFVIVEHAKTLLRYGHPDDARHAIAQVESGPDRHLQAEAGVVRASIARAEGDLDAALAEANAARSAALEAVAPVSYFSASVELAEALRMKGDRTGAYGALVTAWATLSDVVGGGAAHSWVDPLLTAYNLAWGDEDFGLAKARYEEARRRARATQ